MFCAVLCPQDHKNRDSAQQALRTARTKCFLIEKHNCRVITGHVIR